MCGCCCGVLPVLVLRAREERRSCLLGEVSAAAASKTMVEVVIFQMSHSRSEVHMLSVLFSFSLICTQPLPISLPPSLPQVRASGPAPNEDRGVWDRRAFAALRDGHGILLGQALSGRGREGGGGGREWKVRGCSCTNFPSFPPSLPPFPLETDQEDHHRF